MKKNFLSFLLIAGFIFSSISVFGQGAAEITGKVVSAQEALPGAVCECVRAITDDYCTTPYC